MLKKKHSCHHIYTMKHCGKFQQTISMALFNLFFVSLVVGTIAFPADLLFPKGTSPNESIRTSSHDQIWGLLPSLRRSRRLRSSLTSLESSKSSDEFRKSLEFSWNAPVMGTVIPTDPEEAALIAARSVCSYLSSESDEYEDDDDSVVVRVEIGLPAYDPTSGPNLFDEAASITFAAALGAGLKDNINVNGDVSILVVDGNTEQLARNVLQRKARLAETWVEEKRQNSSPSDSPPSEGGMISRETSNDYPLTAAPAEVGGDDISRIIPEELTIRGVENEGVKRDTSEGASEDDSDLFAGIGDTDIDDVTNVFDIPYVRDDSDGLTLGDAANTNAVYDGIDSETNSLDSIESFRLMLEQSYEFSNDTIPDVKSERNEIETVKRANIKELSRRILPDGVRLGSLLGYAKISEGRDGVSDVIDAVDGKNRGDTNAPAVLATDSAVIVLAPFTQNHSKAIRRILSEHCTGSLRKKVVVLVNCKCDPLPRELLRIETVYGISAFVARRKTPQYDPFTGGSFPPPDDPTAQPKAVVMRRYPQDWEIFVDAATGDGYEFVRSVTPRDVASMRRMEPGNFAASQSTPPLSWVAGLVKEHIIFKEQT